MAHICGRAERIEGGGEEEKEGFGNHDMDSIIKFDCNQAFEA